MLKEDLDLILGDKDYKKLLERFMDLVDIDDNNVIELEELKNYLGAQNILQKYFEKLNVNQLTKVNICELFPTKEELYQIILELQKVFVYGERDQFLLNRKVQAVTNKFCFYRYSKEDMFTRTGEICM
jgi:hypothetical protein